MKTINSLLLVLIVLALLSGCASAPKAYQFARNATISATYDQTWAAVIDIFADRMIPIDNFEKDSGIITSDWINAWSKEQCDCGKAGLFNVIQAITLKFNVTVREIYPGECDLQVTIMYQASIYNTLNKIYWTKACNSTGMTEANMHQRIREAVGG